MALPGGEAGAPGAQPPPRALSPAAFTVGALPPSCDTFSLRVQVQINDWFFEDLTPESTVKLLDDLKAGRPVKIGPQNDRIHSEGPMGRTSLIGPASGPQCRDLTALGK